MIELFGRLIGTIGEPAVVAVSLAAALILAAMKLFYDKQHEFLRERLEYLRQANEDFRRKVEELKDQMTAFEEENRKLRDISSVLAGVARELQDYPTLTSDQLRQLLGTFESLVSSQHQGFARLEAAVKQRAPDREVPAILQQLIDVIAQTRREAGAQLQDLRSRARRLSE